MEVPERVEAVRRYSEIALTLPEPIGNLRRQQMRDISALFDALDDEMREKHVTDTPRGRAQPLEPAGPQPEAGLCPSGEHGIYLLSG